MVTGAQKGGMFLGRQPVCLPSYVLSRKDESKRYFPAMLEVLLVRTFPERRIKK